MQRQHALYTPCNALRAFVFEQLRWRLERVRIVCSLESEFDKSKHGSYYVKEADGKKFVLRRELING